MFPTSSNSTYPLVSSKIVKNQVLITSVDELVTSMYENDEEHDNLNGYFKHLLK